VLSPSIASARLTKEQAEAPGHARSVPCRPPYRPPGSTIYAARMTSYPARTWFDPRLELRTSPIQGQGLFVTGDVAPDEVLMVWGGTVYSVAQLRAGEVPGGISYSIVDDDVLLAGPEDDLDYYLNHSCDPNVWLADGLRIVARRPIRAGEEITGDYALWESEPEYVLAPCRCGAALCRGRITGQDWTNVELRRRYAGHFLPFLQRRMVP